MQGLTSLRNKVQDESFDLMELAVVVPAHNASAHISACLDGLLADGFAPDVITVVDDGSSDDTFILAQQKGVRVLRNDAPLGPAAARNAGAAATKSRLVFFVDADILIAKGTRARIFNALCEHGSNDAVFGSYDATPAAPRLASRYRNLLHHHTHQTADRKAETFWAGIGAVVRSSFDKIGGFDQTRRYLEDVEFGLRLRSAGGRIELIPDLQGTHLKDWTLASIFLTDWKGRALPWARLLAEDRIKLGVLNTSIRHRLSAMLVLLALISFPLAFADARAFILSALLILVFIGVNAGLFRLLWANGGLLLVLASVGFHAFHYVAAMLGLVEARLLPVGNKEASGSETSHTR